MGRDALKRRRQLLSWALYDWANSAFAVTVISGFFPIFFKQFWAHGTATSTSTLYLGLGNTVASLVVALAAPLLGALADRTGFAKRFVTAFAFIGCVFCACLFFVEQGHLWLALLFYIFAVVCFSSANVCYDSLLVLVSNTGSRHRDSALGYSLGYLGGGLLFLLSVAMVLKPAVFGFTNTSAAIRFSFINVAIWWAVFTIPLLIFVNVKANRITPASLTRMNLDAIQSIKNTLKQVRHNRNIWLFLLAYWLYIDGVVTIIKMGVDFGLSIGLPTNSLIIALLIVQFIGFPSTLLFGRLANKNVFRALWIILTIYVLCTAYAYFLNTATEFYVLAVILGLVQGGGNL